MSGKVGTFSKQSGLYKRYFFIMRILFTKLQSYSLCFRQTKWYMQNIPSVTGITCAKCKNYNIVCNSFNTFFCTKDHITHQVISCYRLLHQAARVEGKNSLRKRRDILVSDRYQQQLFHYYNNLILICDVLSSYWLYYVQFKETKILWQCLNWNLCSSFSQLDSASGVACIKSLDNADLLEEF